MLEQHITLAYCNATYPEGLSHTYIYIYIYTYVYIWPGGQTRITTENVNIPQCHELVRYTISDSGQECKLFTDHSCITIASPI